MECREGPPPPLEMATWTVGGLGGALVFHDEPHYQCGSLHYRKSKLHGICTLWKNRLSHLAVSPPIIRTYLAGKHDKLSRVEVCAYNSCIS